MDKLSPQQRHKNMAAIRSKDTKPEMVVRRFLWSHGFRYRLNHPRLPGKPDIVLRKYRACIFVNGCFWHGHNTHEGESGLESSDCCKIPKSNTDFWVKKIKRNIQRDDDVKRKLSDMGWYSITIWECQLKPKMREQTLNSLSYTLNYIYFGHQNAPDYTIEEEESMLVAEDLSDGYGMDE